MAGKATEAELIQAEMDRIEKVVAPYESYLVGRDAFKKDPYVVAIPGLDVRRARIVGRAVMKYMTRARQVEWEWESKGVWRNKGHKWAAAQWLMVEWLEVHGGENGRLLLEASRWMMRWMPVTDTWSRAWIRAIRRQGKTYDVGKFVPYVKKALAVMMFCEMSKRDRAPLEKFIAEFERGI